MSHLLPVTLGPVSPNLKHERIISHVIFDTFYYLRLLLKNARALFDFFIYNL